MTNKIANRVKMTVSGAPGTGPITLGSAVSGFQSFTAAGVSNNDTVPYVLEDGTSWEIGVGTYTASGTSLARTSITASSNSGSAISATANAIVMISPLAADLQAGTAAGNLVQLDGSAKLPAVDGSALTALNGSNIATGTIASARIDTGTSANKIIALDASAKYPAADGSLITNLNMGAAASGTLSVGRGGTGLTSLTAGYIPYGNGTGAFSSSSGFVFDGLNLGIGGSPTNFGAGYANLSLVTTSGAAFYDAKTTSVTLRMQAVEATEGRIGTTTAHPITIYTSGTEKLRIASDGSVGIGTSSPNSAFKATFNGQYGIRIQSADTNNSAMNIGTDPANGIAFIDTTKTGTGSFLPLRFATSDQERMRLDTSGNLGLGVTPSAWGSGTKAFQYGSYGSVYNVGQAVLVGANVYYDGTNNVYLNTNPASNYRQYAGGHYWYSAASGTAGSAISFGDPKMTLDASGRLGIGTTSPGYTLDVLGAMRFQSTSADAYLRVTANTNNYAGIISFDAANAFGASYSRIQSTYGSTTSWAIGGNGSDLTLAFSTNGSERARIDASGNLLVGTTTTRNRLTVASGTTVTNPTLGTLSGTTFFGGSDLGYGLMTGQASSGDYWFQVQRVDASATAYNLRLQPSGGNVQIGNLTTNGAVYSNGTALTNTNPSDARLKDDIEPIKWGLSEILSLRPVSFKWKNDPKPIRSTSYGYIAQEAQSVMPELVSEFEQDNATYLGLDVVGINTTIVRAIQELAAKVSALEARQ